MALTRIQKEELLAGYAAGLGDLQHAFLIGYQGISVPQVTELRRRVRAEGGKYIVVKNSLAVRAVAGKALGQLSAQLSGPTAIAYGAADPVALARVLSDFAKDAPAIKFKGALLEGRALAGTAVKEIASLPSRQELLAKLVFLLQSPITRFVRVLAALPQQFVATLDQIRQKKENQG